MAHSRMVVKPPGLKASEWLKRSRASKVQAPSHIFPGLVSVSGEGSYITDVDGNTYLDFTTQRFPIGYAQPEVSEAIHQAIISGGDADESLAITCAEKLKRLLPTNLSDGLVHFTRGGTLATEHTILTLKKYSGRSAFIAFQGSYHGSALASLSLTMNRAEMKRGLYPFMADVIHVPYAYCYRCPFGQDYPNCGYQCLEYIKYTLDTVVSPTEVAACFIEPIQSHGGVIVPPGGYVQGIRNICDEYGIVLVDDEIVTGLGRTGKMFGIENYNVDADIILLGKSLGGPLPLGAVIGKGALMEVHTEGTGTSTIPCAAALAMIDVILDKKLSANALKLGKYLLKRLKEMQEEHDIVGDVRGKGLLIGLEFVENPRSKKPATRETKEIVLKAYENGLLIIPGGTYRQSVRLAPPLNLTEEQADEAIGILEKSLRALGL